MAHSIDELETVEHPDRSIEVIVCDETLRLILDGLPRMGLTIPIGEDDWERVEYYLEGLDIGIGSVEADGIFPTQEYNERVGRAVDEINIGYRYDFINHETINRRLADLMEKLGRGGTYTLEYERWLPAKKKTETKKGKNRKVYR